jgi:excisionase family DNA binding protein
MAMKIIDGSKIWIDDDALVSVHVKELSKKPVSELITLKDYWIEEHRKSKKLDEISIRRKRDASHWLAAIDELITTSNYAMKTSDDPEYMDISETAKYLRVSESKLYKMTSKKEIPHSKIGKTLRFKRCDIDEFIETKNKSVDKSLSEKADVYVANYPLKKEKKKNTH